VFDAKCPCCGARLLIDQRTRKIVSHTTEEEQEKSTEERFDASLDKVKRSKAEQDSKFAAAQERERQRKERLASLFDDATKKVDDEGPVDEPPQKYWD